MGDDSKPKPRVTRPSRPDIREELDEDDLDPRLQAALNRQHTKWQWEFDQLRAGISIAPPKPAKDEARPIPSFRPPMPAPKAHWLAHLAAALTSFAGVLVVVVTLVKALADLKTVPPGVATKQDVADLDKRCLARDQALSLNALNFRNQVVGVWELQGVKTVDPPGTPPRAPVTPLPPPLANNPARRPVAKLPAAPAIQVSEPIALPPTFDAP